MPTRTRYSDNWVMGDSLSVAGSTPWRIRRPCTGAPGRDFPPDVGATATSGRRSPPEVLSAHRGKLALPPRGPCGDIGHGTGGRVATSDMVQGGSNTMRLLRVFQEM